MKSLKYSFFLLIILAFNLNAMPTTITYQGRLFDGGDPANGNYTLKFAIFDSETDGNQLWPDTGYETHTVAVADGYYTVTLGNGDTPVPIGTSVFDADNTWLELYVNETAMPRTKIHAVPYSMQAKKLSGVSPNAEGDIMRWDGTKWVAVNFKNYYRDKDNDSYGDKYILYLGYEMPEGYVDNDLDCNDDDPAINPDAAEIDDGIDNDCNGQVDDGLNSEICDGIDNDGDGLIDEDLPTTIFYRDNDNDGWGDGSITQESCLDVLDGYVTRGYDCNDYDAGINPDAGEICDGIDNDCDGDVDEMAPCDLPHAIAVCDGANGCVITDCESGWADCDGNPYNGCETDLTNDANNCGSCDNVCPDGFACQNGECVEIIDDADNDGYTSDVDCNDNDASINPGATEIPGDGIDNNCDGYEACYVDNDNDGYGSNNLVNSVDLDCIDMGEAATNDPLDCNDNDASVNPGAEETCDDGVDNNCNDQIDEDCMQGLFITPNGDDNNPGTKNSPMKTINAAINKAIQNSVSDIHIAAGAYNETVLLQNSVNIHGGYDPATWNHDPTLYKTQINGGQKALIGESIDGIIVEGLNVYSADGTNTELSSYGVFLTACSNLQFKFSNIFSGNGFSGKNGIDGTNGENGNGGGNGEPGCENGDLLCETCTRPSGGIGATGFAYGENISGGNGGRPGLGDNIYWAESGEDGNGINGAGGYAGTIFYQGHCSDSYVQGENGGDGAKGGNGAGGDAIGLVNSLGYIPSDGGNGTRGQNGGGGGGGGGGRGGINLCDSYGSSGGGGGSGGSGGLPGTGGTGGGGSFGMFIIDCSNIIIENCKIESKNGGAGGNPGLGGFGGTGGPGGSGGLYGGSNEQDDGGCGGNGGDGGDGGNGGYGGGGGGGPSICILHQNSTINNINTTLYFGSGGSGGYAGLGNSGQNGISQDIYNY